ncbi:MAG: chemotaxis protein, partial [Deltaproteobacteria bacterium]|nr:chemotaxis protein [Deltaproteobacteria bacterium]
VSFRPIRRTRVRSLLESFVGCSLRKEDGTGVLGDLKKSSSIAQVVHALNRLSLVVREMAEHGVRPDPLRTLIGRAYDAAIASIGRLALEAIGEPPVPFAFISAGSNSRHEMTMFSDQDNGLVFADVPAADKDVVTRYFLKLGDQVCSGLNEVGYPYCPGGIMAVNPKWCHPLSEWKVSLAGWIGEATPEAILEVNVFADIRCSFGDPTLVEKLNRHLHAVAEQTPTFFLHFARNSLLYKVPVDFLGKSKAKKTGLGLIDIKECIKPLEIFARIYALKHKISEPSTVGRLRQLEASGVLSSALLDETIYVFDYLWRMRFYNQLFSHADLRQVNDTIDVSLLTDVERENLRNVLARISALQEKLCKDFLGMPRHMVSLE